MKREHLLHMVCLTHFLVRGMTKLEGEHFPSISRQGQREESIQGHLFQLFHTNIFHLPHKVVIRFLPQPTLLARGSNDFENNTVNLSDTSSHCLCLLPVTIHSIHKNVLKKNNLKRSFQHIRVEGLTF